MLSGGDGIDLRFDVCTGNAAWRVSLASDDNESNVLLGSGSGNGRFTRGAVAGDVKVELLGVSSRSTVEVHDVASEVLRSTPLAHLSGSDDESLSIQWDSNGVAAEYCVFVRDAASVNNGGRHVMQPLCAMMDQVSLDSRSLCTEATSVDLADLLDYVPSSADHVQVDIVASSVSGTFDSFAYAPLTLPRSLMAEPSTQSETTIAALGITCALLLVILFAVFMVLRRRRAPVHA
jgi:hypothetical protein